MRGSIEINLDTGTGPLYRNSWPEARGAGKFSQKRATQPASERTNTTIARYYRQRAPAEIRLWPTPIVTTLCKIARLVSSFSPFIRFNRSQGPTVVTPRYPSYVRPWLQRENWITWRTPSFLSLSCYSSRARFKGRRWILARISPRLSVLFFLPLSPVSPIFSFFSLLFVTRLAQSLCSPIRRLVFIAIFFLSLTLLYRRFGRALASHRPGPFQFPPCRARIYPPSSSFFHAFSRIFGERS